MNKTFLRLGAAVLLSPIFVTVKSFANSEKLMACKGILETYAHEEFGSGVTLADMKCEDGGKCELVLEVSGIAKLVNVMRLALRVDSEAKNEGQRTVDMPGEEAGGIKPFVVRFKVEADLVEDTLQGLVLNNLVAPVAAEHLLATDGRFNRASNGSNRDTKSAPEKISEFLSSRSFDSRILWIYNSDKTSKFATGKTHLARAALQQVLFGKSAFSIKDSVLVSADLSEMGAAGMWGGGRDFKVSYFPKEMVPSVAAEGEETPAPTLRDVNAVAKEKSLVIIDEVDVSSALGDITVNLMLDAYMNEGRTIIIFSRSSLESFLEQKFNSGQNQGSGAVLISKLRTLTTQVGIVVNTEPRKRNN